MKTTTFHHLANPRRTTLAHLEETEVRRTPERRDRTVVLPPQTANPRRTILA
ncbi:hypothetical protein OG909_23860 [Streptomyces sp. NBC_01754]|uniref:hypothetical protein n=1 Tax=Streptomyces sp. NBC_01754 TaxID=2975930 RepID=UPI002DDB5429|nr:hypothetical protein [Streptomyces sp. NBC_01754]WSC95067.1 hypothetical protein OG909_23860 [Streptomyces sp. NBC_01754]